MGSASVWLVSLVLHWGLLPSLYTTLSYAAVYYVTPHTPNPSCPTTRELCLTINEYAQVNHFDGDDNITLLFLNGEHNLTAQNLEINDKISLEMGPNKTQSEIVLYVIFGTSIRVQNIQKVEITKLKLNFQVSSNNHKDTPVCLSLSDTNVLSLFKVSVESCQLFLLGKMEATISDLTTSMSAICVTSNQTNQTVTIRNSELHFSILNISDSLVGQTSVGDTVTNALSVKSSSINSSLVVVKLQTQLVYDLLIFNTSVFSEEIIKFETGIKFETSTTARLFALIENSHIVGTSHGINVTVDGESRVELSVNKCRIAKNGKINDKSGGVAVHQLGNATTITKVVSSMLSGNKFSQFKLTGNFVDAKVLVFNSTIQDTHTMQVRSNSTTSYLVGGGADFQLSGIGTYCQGIVANFTDNLLENNDIGVLISGSKCTFEVHFDGNTIVSPSQWKSSDTLGFYINTANTSKGVVNIKNCHFIHNTGAAMDFNMIGNITIEHSILEDNNGACLIATCLQSNGCKFTNSIITLQNVTFFNNTSIIPNTGIIQVDSSAVLNIEDSCLFRANKGSVIQAQSTSVSLSGIVTFENNIGFQGSAISLSCSKLIIQSINNTNTNVTFVNNTATNTGGGIFYACSFTGNNDFLTRSSCFYDIQGVSFNELINSEINVSLVFINNTAANGGADIYGVTPNSECKVSPENMVAFEVQSYVFKTTSNKSVCVSSDPKRVCLCDSSSQLMCSNLSYIFHNTTRYPGEVFSLSLAVVGFDFGAVSGPVYAHLLSEANNSMSFLESDQKMRQIHYNALNACSQLNFTVNSRNSKETIIITVTDTVITEKENITIIKSLIKDYTDKKFYRVIPYTLLTVPVYITVSLLPCPPGFQPTAKGSCDCATVLKKIGIDECFIYDNTSYITRSGNQWISSLYNKNGSRYTLSTKHCPVDYCYHSTINFNFSDPDKQCALGHTGILCGACPSNLSLAIGSSRCLYCSSNNHTLLLITFAAAGIVLVLFIKILDVTVATGTINGLILYANIIWANQNTLFPPQNQTSLFLQFLKTFIAWLNLDLGIETCFIQHLDGYWKTWLQFVFPFYIWLIAGLIILVSHYSIKATSLFGNNSVSVLATLFLLAYAKLLRTIITVLELVVLDVGAQNGSQSYRLVWNFDGNVLYFDLQHSILFVASIAILLIFWLPYTLVLLFIQFLRRYSNHCLLRWVNKLNPLFDSYLGPLKIKHHYWIGMGLLVRLVLLLVSAVTLTTIPFISTLGISLIAVLLGMLVFNIYKQWQLNLLEGCFLVNMAMFSSGALFIEAQDIGSKDALACTSLGITFLLFLAIIAYHVWRRFQLLKRWYKKAHSGYDDIDNQCPAQHDQPLQTTTYQVVSAPRLRESLLESIIA